MLRGAAKQKKAFFYEGIIFIDLMILKDKLIHNLKTI
jgi:hypothetical protein